MSSAALLILNRSKSGAIESIPTTFLKRIYTFSVCELVRALYSLVIVIALTFRFSSGHAEGSHQNLLGLSVSSDHEVGLKRALTAWQVALFGDSKGAEETWQSVLISSSSSKKEAHKVPHQRPLGVQLSHLGLIYSSLIAMKDGAHLTVEDLASHLDSWELDDDPYLSLLLWVYVNAWFGAKEDESPLDKAILERSDQLLKRWLDPSHIKESELERAQRSIECSPIQLSTFRCTFLCPKRSDATLMIKEPWALISVSLLSNSIPFERSGRTSHLGSPLELCPHSIDKEGTHTHLGSLEILSLKPPQLLWLLPKPTAPQSLLRSAPSSLLGYWDEQLRLSISLSPQRSLFPIVHWRRLRSESKRIWTQFRDLIRREAETKERDKKGPKGIPTLPIDPCENKITEVTKIIQDSWKSHSVNLRRQNELKSDLKRHCMKNQSWGADLPNHAVRAWKLADLLISLGEERSDLIPHLLRRFPHDEKVISWVKSNPDWTPGSKDTTRKESPLDLVEEFKKSPWPPLLKGHLGQLLDQQILYYNAVGQGLRSVSEVIRVNTREGVELLGELILPKGASPISLYQLKPNGGRRAPMHILETGGYSFNDLQVGDWLIAEYVEPIETLRRDETLLTPRIFIRDRDRAVWKRSIYLSIAAQTKVLRPEATLPPKPLILRLPSEPSLGEIEMSLEPDLTAQFKTDLDLSDRERYLAFNPTQATDIAIHFERLTPSPLEPFSPFLSSASPYLQLGHEYDPQSEWLFAEKWVQQLIAEESELCPILSGLSPELDLKSVQQLSEWVWWRTQREQALFDASPPYRSLMTGRGNRGLLMSALLKACGQEHTLWLAKAKSIILSPKLISLDDYDHLLLRIKEEWLDPSIPYSPLGIVAPEIAGGSAILLASFDQKIRNKSSTRIEKQIHPYSAYLKGESLSLPNSLQKLPLTYELKGTLALDLDAPEGTLGARALSGQLVHIFYGADAAIFRAKMEEANPEALKSWIERQWALWWGPSEAREIHFRVHNDHLELTYQLRVWVRANRSLKLNPQVWGERFGSQERRDSDLILPIVNQRISLKLKGVNLSEDSLNQEITYPSSHKKTSSLGSFSIQHSSLKNLDEKNKGDETQLVIKGEWRLRGGIVKTEDYPSWRKFAQKVERAELIKLEWPKPLP